MSILEYVRNEDLKKIIDDKIINSSSFKSILKAKGIIPVCNKTEDLSEMVYRHFFGIGVIEKLHEVLNFDQNNLKSTVAIISAKNENSDFFQDLTDEFHKFKKIKSSEFRLNDILHNNDSIQLQYLYDKPQKGRIELISNKQIKIDIDITKIDKNKYKVNIKHDGVSDAKHFISFLGDMVKTSKENALFDLKRITLDSLSKTNKVNLFDTFSSETHNEWRLIDITNVSVNKGNINSTENAEDYIIEELDENEATGKLTGIKSAILSGGGLRSNDFVRECMNQGFMFSSMRYKFQHKSEPITIELDINFKQTDLKLNITKAYQTDENGLDYLTTLPRSNQKEYLNYFQNVVYAIYSKLIKEQMEELKIRQEEEIN